MFDALICGLCFCAVFGGLESFGFGPIPFSCVLGLRVQGFGIGFGGLGFRFLGFGLGGSRFRLSS